MPSMIGFRLEGSKELERALGELPIKLRKRVLGKVMRKPARAIVKTARKLVPRETGLLRESLGLVIRKYDRGASLAAIIGPRSTFKSKIRAGLTGKKARRRPSKIAHLVEFGTKPHMQKFAFIGGKLVGTFQHPGTAPKPFLRPAFEAQKIGYKQRLGVDLAKGIELEAKKLAR